MIALILVLSGYIFLAYLPRMIMDAPRIAYQNAKKILIMAAVMTAWHLGADLIYHVAYISIHNASASEPILVKAHARNGAWVAPSYKSSPDHSYINNYGSKGNLNPYTGSQGTQSFDTYSKKRK